MIRCKLCGRWVSRIHNSDLELRHLDTHGLEKNGNYPLLNLVYLKDNFEVVHI